MNHEDECGVIPECQMVPHGGNCKVSGKILTDLEQAEYELKYTEYMKDDFLRSVDIRINNLKARIFQLKYPVD